MKSSFNKWYKQLSPPLIHQINPLSPCNKIIELEITITYLISIIIFLKNVVIDFAATIDIFNFQWSSDLPQGFTTRFPTIQKA